MFSVLFSTPFLFDNKLFVDCKRTYCCPNWACKRVSGSKPRCLQGNGRVGQRLIVGKGVEVFLMAKIRRKQQKSSLVEITNLKILNVKLKSARLCGMVWLFSYK